MSLFEAVPKNVRKNFNFSAHSIQCSFQVNIKDVLRLFKSLLIVLNPAVIVGQVYPAYCSQKAERKT